MTARFYYPGSLSSGQMMVLPMNISHHAIRVLRLKQGDTLILFNGRGGEFSGSIEHIDKSNCTVRLSKFHEVERESPLTIHLVQAVCVNEKMDWIIQKSVELGVSHIQPVTANRSVVRLSEARAHKRRLHWQQIAIAACEQCGRNHVPELLPLQSISEWFSQQLTNKPKNTKCKLAYRFMLSASANKRLTEYPSPAREDSITLLIGPEGGFTDDEEKAAFSIGFMPVRLGPRILRTESAGLVAIAAAQTLWGDY
ncbi:MAG TPA: 16S rRNA (uracil(1498)-N(3))-methyltransferase [Nitrosomonas nitrosa]|nr:16S rRNA (uracil(1498)-N(3))-methyltransferase [Nitrosomonas nitrosa]